MSSSSEITGGAPISPDHAPSHLSNQPGACGERGKAARLGLQFGPAYGIILRPNASTQLAVVSSKFGNSNFSNLCVFGYKIAQISAPY